MSAECCGADETISRLWAAPSRNSLRWAASMSIDEMRLLIKSSGACACRRLWPHRRVPGPLQPELIARGLVVRHCSRRRADVGCGRRRRFA